LRIAIINQFFPPDISPTGRLAASLAKHRASQGDTVTVIAGQGYVAHREQETPALQRSRVFPQRNRQDQVRIHRIWTPRLGKRTIFHRGLDYLVFYLLSAWTALRLPRQDVIICLTTPPLIAGVGILHQLLHRKTRVILWNMDCYPEVAERTKAIRSGGIVSRLFDWGNRIVARHLSHIICLDDAMRRLVHQRAGHDHMSVSVIPNWEPVADFLKDVSPQEAKVSDSNFVVLYSGNMGAGHTFESLLAAVEILFKKRPLVRFVLTGGGMQAKVIEQQIEYRNLKNVDFLGYVPAKTLERLQNEASCTVITLQDEMLGCMSPSKLHRSLAMGLPVIYIGPVGSSVDQAVGRYKCGMSLRNGDVSGLVKTIEKMVASRELCQSYARQARRAFEECYCDKRTLPLFDNLIDSLPIVSPRPNELRRVA
jgi:glycosyltransferase involved in cell wall biosynthesis